MDNTTLLAIIAIIISLIATLFTVRAFSLKKGISLRGTFSICSDIACEDNYIARIAIENLKDKAIAIYGIYLKVGHNYFIQIEEFRNKPLILAEFETYSSEYEPLEYYSVGSRRVKLNDILTEKKIKQTLVVSTSFGKFVIKKSIKRWDPWGASLSNHYTAHIIPIRTIHEGKSIGGNTKYLVEFFGDNGETSILHIYPNDYQVQKYRNFQLTKEALESCDTLEDFFYELIVSGKLFYSDFKVHDMEEWRKKNYIIEDMETINAEYYNWFQYYIIGKITTYIDQYKLRRENKKMTTKRDKSAVNRDGS